MERRIDLHVHTTASDGTDTPSQAVKHAKELGLAAIAITDHDSVGGVTEAQQTGQELGVEVVAGIEISADYLGNKAHILGFFIDPGSEALRPALDWAVNERADRNRKIVGSMAADGLDISIEALKAAYPDSVLGRPHMAEYLMKKGYVSSVQEAFDRFLAEGGKYYRPKARMPLTQAVHVIQEAGGIAVVAHPMQYGYDDQERERYITTAKEAGCVALEAYYSEHSSQEQQYLLETAARYGMGVSGGSDYHGSRKPHIQMGSGIDNGLYVPYHVLEGLQALRHS